MRKLQAIWAIGINRLGQILFNTRTAAVGLLMGIFVFSVVQPFADFALANGVPITPYAPPFLLDDQVCQLFIMLGAIALYSGSPYKDNLYPYVLQRAGKTAMILGNALGMLLVASMYVAFLFLAMALPMLGNLSFGEKWGKVWTTMAAYPELLSHAYIPIQEAVRTSLSPASAMALSFFLQTFCTFFLGTVVYFGNNLTARPVGIWLAGGFAMLDITIYNMYPDTLNRYSPLGLARLSTYLDSFAIPLSNSPLYGFLFFGIGCAIALLFIGVYDYTRKDML